MDGPDPWSELVSRWYELRRQGRAVSPEELCDDPAGAAELRRRLEALAGMEAFVGQVNGPESLTRPAGAPAARGEGAAPCPSAIGSYDILGELGRGGMGVVYKAVQRGLNRVVALKMIVAGGHAGPEELARFRAEAEAIARLRHPNIVQVYEVGEHQGVPFFSLEFCPAGSLDKKLDGTPLSPSAAAALVEPLARAMRAAHQKGVVHRDLKPANVLLADDGTPKVTDFGLAKRLGDTQRTATGAVLGTPSYMAPEQARGKRKQVGPAADIFALGAILYELLTGRPPFRADTPLDTLLQVTSEEVTPPRRRQPTIPRDLEVICLKCLHKQPHRRYASAGDLADDLGRFLRGEPIRARGVPAWDRAGRWAKRRSGVIALAAVMLLALGWTGYRHGAALTRLLAGRGDQPQTEPEDARPNEPVPEPRADDPAPAADARADGLPPGALTRLGALRASQAAPVTAVAFSPDGQALAATGDDGTTTLWDLRAARERWHVTSPNGRAGAVAFAPSGGALAAIGVSGRVELLDVATGNSRAAFGEKAGHCRGLAFSPDGTTLAAVDHDGNLMSWAVEGPAGPRGVRCAAAVPGRVLLYDPEAPGGRRAFPVGDPMIVPPAALAADGTALAVGSEGEGRVYLVDPATGHERQHWPHADKPPLCVALSRSGRVAATGDVEGSVRLFDAATGKELTRLAGHNGPVRALAFAPDSDLLASAGDDTTVLVWDLGRVWRVAARAPAAASLPGLWDDLGSPDGAVAARAVADLGTDPARALALVKERMKPWPPDGEQRLSRAVADLESANQQVRAGALKELRRHGADALPPLRELQRTAASPQLQARLRAFFASAEADGLFAFSESSRELRALQLLETAATPEARQMLEEVAQGGASAQLTEAAKAALRRLDESRERLPYRERLP
jgi:hypothetical protein